MTIAIEILIIWKKPGTKSYDCNRDAHYLCQYINDFMSEYPEKSRLKLRYFHENPAVGVYIQLVCDKEPISISISRSKASVNIQKLSILVRYYLE